MKKYVSILFVCFTALWIMSNAVAQQSNEVSIISTNISPPISTNTEPSIVSTNEVPVVSTNIVIPVSTNVIIQVESNKLVVVFINYVQKWPRPLIYDGSVWGDPTPEQCRAAGYELEANRPPPTAEEVAQAEALAQIAAQVAASNAAIAQAEQDARSAAILAEQTAKTNKIQGYRNAYVGATGQLCALAGIPVVRVLTMVQIQEAVMPLLAGENAGMVNGLMILLTNLEMKLIKEDGPNALDNI